MNEWTNLIWDANMCSVLGALYPWNTELCSHDDFLIANAWDEKHLQQQKHMYHNGMLVSSTPYSVVVVYVQILDQIYLMACTYKLQRNQLISM